MDKRKLKKKFLRHGVYLSFILLLIIVFLGDIPLYEKIFRGWILTYITLMFNFFIDKEPPKYARLANILKEKESNYYEEYLNTLTNILSITLKSMNYVKNNDITTEEKQEYIEYNLRVIKTSCNRIKKLETPPKYKERQEEIVSDIEGFIEVYKDMFEVI